MRCNGGERSTHPELHLLYISMPVPTLMPRDRSRSRGRQEGRDASHRGRLSTPSIRPWRRPASPERRWLPQHRGDADGSGGRRLGGGPEPLVRQGGRAVRPVGPVRRPAGPVRQRLRAQFWPAIPAVRVGARWNGICSGPVEPRRGSARNPGPSPLRAPAQRVGTPRGDGPSPGHVLGVPDLGGGSRSIMTVRFETAG